MPTVSGQIKIKASKIITLHLPKVVILGIKDFSINGPLSDELESSNHFPPPNSCTKNRFSAHSEKDRGVLKVS
jgi:hypothetical protein